MTEKDILRAIGGIDPSLILAAERVQKKISWKKWIATAACFLLIAFVAVGYYNVVFRGANAGDPGPQNYKFSTLAEMNAAIGKETLCNDNTVICDDDTVIQVSCFEDESGIIDLHKPSQLNVIAYDGDIRIEYYIIFGRDDVSQSYVGGYEEQNLRREINGITVHYSKIYDGFHHSQAKFIYDGDLYVIDVTSKEDIHDIQDYIDKILG
jgi:hypothetical protein